MTIGQQLGEEMKHLSAGTRRMLERAPFEKFSWKPHEKSMDLGRLATHLAEIPTWTDATLLKDEIDFAAMDYKPYVAGSIDELLELHKKNSDKALATVLSLPDEEFSKGWTMRNGEKVYFTQPKLNVVRSFVLDHTIHHRGQMAVYLRLLNVPVPGMFGPTADENNF